MKIFVFLLILLQSQAFAQCPSWVATATEENILDKNIIKLKFDDQDISRIPPSGAQVSLLIDSGKIIDGVIDYCSLDKSQFTIRVRTETSIDKGASLFQIISPVLVKSHDILKQSVQLTPGYAKGKAQTSTTDVSVDTNKDGYPDLVIQSFCLKKKCAGDYTISELHVLINGQWKYCLKIDPM